jgi:membrane-bound lytic murein transglycosylase B
MPVISPVYNRLLTFILALLISGCASERVDLEDENRAQNKPYVMKQSAHKPTYQNEKKDPNTTTVQPKTYNDYRPSIHGSYSNSLAVRNFIRHMVVKHGFSEPYLTNLFSQANRLDSVIRLENPPSTYSSSPPRPGSWTRYRNKFLTDAHINNGVQFWAENANAIAEASSSYHVDPEYIVAIIGVETYFGRNIGKTCIFDALTTLAFDTYRRSKFFTSELENFLLMTREEGYDPRRPVGSWAGAMGLGQFMPSSFRRLAVDFNHDGRRDLWHEHDAIGSVAHYFSRSGWHYNNPVAQQAHFPNDNGTISLSTYEGDEFWRTYPNFKVIKHYNNSNKYAMAVHQLAQAIKVQYLRVAYRDKPYPVAQRLYP